EDDAPPPPQEVLRKLRVTHIVLTDQLPASSLAMALWRDPDQFPFWELTGRGVVYGWNDPDEPGPDLRSQLRLDPVARAFGPAARPVPSQTGVSAPPARSAWAVYLRGLPPIPVDAYDAPLWPAY